MLFTLQKDKDGDSEAPAEDAREAVQASMDPAVAHAHAVAAAASARRLNTSAAAAEHVRIAAIRRAAKFVTVRAYSCNHLAHGTQSQTLAVVSAAALQDSCFHHNCFDHLGHTVHHAGKLLI